VARRRHGGVFLVPAGALIGLSLGILAGYMVTGLLIGLGAGFIAVIMDRPGRELKALGEGYPPPAGAADIVLFFTGIYIVLSGIAITIVPNFLWPEIAAGFFLLLGAWFVARGMTGRREGR